MLGPTPLFILPSIPRHRQHHHPPLIAQIKIDNPPTYTFIDNTQPTTIPGKFFHRPLDTSAFISVSFH
jgi:hypothetical protein